jgi:hypothetical protein
MEKIFEFNEFIQGRMISYSKSQYREKYPENEIYFNCNVFVLGEGKIWYGDLDVTKDREALEKIASEIGKDLYILREMDGRFENENLDDPEIIRRSVCKISK